MPKILRAGFGDLIEVIELKLRMFEEVGRAHLLAPNAQALIFQDYQRMFKQDLAAHFVATDNGSIIACAGGFLKNDIPYSYFRNPVYGFVGDVYVRPEARRQGLARALSAMTIDWLRKRGVETIRLLASEVARPIYSSLGFRATDEMALHLDPSPDHPSAA